MLVKKRFYQNPFFWRRVLIASPIVVYLICFRAEIWLLMQFILAILSFFVVPDVVIPFNLETLKAFFVLVYTLLGIGLLFDAMLYLEAYFVLPAETHDDHVNVFKRMRLYAGRKHGPAIFIRDGMKVASPEEMNKPGPGVALVSMNSAVVLEKRVRYSPKSSKVSQNTLIDQVSGKSFRVEGPGLVFLAGGETVRKVVDLRNQSRSLSGIFAMTRDGIEVSTTVSAVFTLGQPPPILKVAYVGGDSYEYLCVLILDERLAIGNNVYRQKMIHVKDVSDELDIDDKKEIHRVAQRLITESYASPAPTPPPPTRSFWAIPRPPKTEASPFKLYKDRIFAAILSQPLEKAQSHEQDVEKRYVDWRDLPPRVAAEIYRNLIARHYYDALYEPASPKDYPMSKLKGKFSILVRNQGMLSIQLLQRKDGQRLAKDWKGTAEELDFTLPYPLETPKVLRSRGLVVLNATFGDLNAHGKVQDGLMENWLSYWKREKDETLAQHELTASRIITAERAQVQRDMAYTFAKLMQSSEYTQETLVWRLYQAFEALAADPKTRQFLPETTQKTMTNLRDWLASNEIQAHEARPSSASPQPPTPPSDQLLNSGPSSSPDDDAHFTNEQNQPPENLA
jgi:hypothetical protein